MTLNPGWVENKWVKLKYWWIAPEIYLYTLHIYIHTYEVEYFSTVSISERENFTILIWIIVPCSSEKQIFWKGDLDEWAKMWVSVVKVLKTTGGS